MLLFTVVAAMAVLAYETRMAIVQVITAAPMSVPSRPCRTANGTSALSAVAMALVFRVA